AVILFLVALLQRSDPADVFFAIVALIAVFGLFLYYMATATARLLGWPLARYVAIPLGLDRVAGILAREAIEWQRDPTGGALLAGALALLARDRHDEAIATRLAGALAEIQDIGAAGVIASGL